MHSLICLHEMPSGRSTHLPATCTPKTHLPHATVRLGELNASCIGFTTHLELADVLADTIIARLTPPSGAPATAPTDEAPMRDQRRRTAGALKGAALLVH